MRVYQEVDDQPVPLRQHGTSLQPKFFTTVELGP
jgi:hypothetical protein